MQTYDATTEEMMTKFYGTLSEKDKRRYAAIEALKLGHGGQVYIAEVLGCDRNTIQAGIQDLQGLPQKTNYEPRVRKEGGGRKDYEQMYPDMDVCFLDVLQNYTAGDPMDDAVRWTNLTPKEIAARLADTHQIDVSVTVIKKLLKKHHYGRRKAQKKTSMKVVEHRNEQFEYIAQQKAEYEDTNNPIISMDTKKKEYLGNFYRDGRLYTQEEVQTYDHDFNSFATGIVIPHGLYDLKQNIGYLNLGTSFDTSQFACDNLRRWWFEHGRYDYPEATSILLLCDGGGSNGSGHYLFKADLQHVVDEIGIEIQVAHYPPYASKYNPIEHRLFPHVTRACQGVIFKSIELVEELMAKTSTSKGLEVFVNIVDRVYEKGRQVAETFKQNLPIVFDDFLPKWNYRAIPNAEVI